MLHLTADGGFRVLYDAVPINRIVGYLLQTARAAVDAVVDAGQCAMLRLRQGTLPFMAIFVYK